MCVTNSDEGASITSSPRICRLCQALTEGVEVQLKMGERHQRRHSHHVSFSSHSELRL